MSEGSLKSKYAETRIRLHDEVRKIIPLHFVSTHEETEQLNQSLILVTMFAVVRSSGGKLERIIRHRRAIQTVLRDYSI